jgi:hypothetical protein
VTEVNGLRLAYRGFVAGLAGGYVWAAIAMLLGALLHADALRALRPIAMAISPLAGSPELSFVLGLAAVQAGGALIGMCFAYFFARFFTIPATLWLGAPVVALLAWALVGAVLAREVPNGAGIATQAVALVATLGYGLMLAARVPLRGEVTRHDGGGVDQFGSPST